MLFNEPKLLKLRSEVEPGVGLVTSFSALQRAEIAEIRSSADAALVYEYGFSALQRAEIAEMYRDVTFWSGATEFQCSSTSRNC